MAFFVQVFITGILIGGVYSLISLPVVMIFKASRIFNFAQGSLVMLGAWVAWSFMDPMRGFGIPWYISILLALIIAILIGFVIERFTLRPLIGQPLFSTIIVTLGLDAMFLGVVFFFWGTITGDSYPPFIPSGIVKLGSVIIATEHLAVFVIALVLMGGFILFFKYHRYGLAMRAVAEEHQVSEALGIRVTAILRITWILGCVITFMAGILLASITSLSLTLDSIALICFVVILMGGLESILGVLVAGPMVGVIEQLTALYIDPLVGGGFTQIMPFIILMVTVLIRPYGIFGLERIERI